MNFKEYVNDYYNEHPIRITTPMGIMDIAAALTKIVHTIPASGTSLALSPPDEKAVRNTFDRFCDHIAAKVTREEDFKHCPCCAPNREDDDLGDIDETFGENEDDN